MIVAIGSLGVEDARKIAIWKSDPILSHQLISDFKETDETKAIDWIKTNSTDTSQCLQGVFLETNDISILVGVVRLMYMDFESLTAELGIYIGDQSNQNQGIGGDALDIMLKKAFFELRLEKIYLKVVSYNERAISLYLKKSFKIEGTLRQHYYSDGLFHDVICMAIFRENFT